MSDKIDLDTAEGFRLALVKVGANLPCPACGNNEWRIWPDQKSREFALMVKPEVAIKAKHPGRHMPLLSKICGNCALVQTHAKMVLQQELDRLESEERDGDE